jgi:hypothetical protein
MGFATIISSLFGFLGQGVKGFFGVKQEQAQIIQQAVKVLGEVNTSDAQKVTAIASMWAADATSTSWLTRMWRPILILGIFGMVVSWWFGYAPPNLEKPMPIALRELFEAAVALTGVGMGGRTLEKIISTISLSGVLKKLGSS